MDSENVIHLNACDAFNGHKVHTSTESDPHGMIEETIVTETRRTTEATMKMEHNVQPEIPMTLTQRTQTPSVAYVSEGTMFDQTLSTSSTNTEPISIATGSTQTQPQTLPMPTISQAPPAPPQLPTLPVEIISHSKNSSLEYFTNIIKKEEQNIHKKDEHYTRFEDLKKTDHSKPHITLSASDDSAKLLAELAEMNLLPEPAPEMGYMPKEQTAETTREHISDRIKKLEVSQQTYTDAPSGGVRILPPVIQSNTPQPTVSVTPVPDVYEIPPLKLPNDDLLPRTTQVSNHKHQETTNTFTEILTNLSYTPDPIYRPSAHLDEQVQEPKQNGHRAHSPRPSAEGVAMDKLWTTHKSQDVPKVFDSSVYHTSKNEFAEEKLTRRFATPISESDTDCDTSHRLNRRNSTKETTKLFENKIREFENSPKHDYDLRAPGLVKQIPPMPFQTRPMSVHESPLLDVYLEPGSPPEICYAPRPATLERKHSLVDVIEQTIEKESVHGPSKVLAGAVRMIPPALKREEFASVKQSNETYTNGFHSTNAPDKPQTINGVTQPNTYAEPKPTATTSGYMADSEDTLKRKPALSTSSRSHQESTSKSIKQTKQIFESYSSDNQQSSTWVGTNGNANQNSVPYPVQTLHQESMLEHSNAFKPFTHSHDQSNGSFQKVRIVCSVFIEHAI